MMKYCVSGRQSKAILTKADQIKLQYKDAGILIDYIKDYENKDFILEIPKEITQEEINWELYKTLSKEASIIFCLENLFLINKCNEYGIKYYWNYPITSYYELKGLADLNPCYLFLGAPLSFNLKKIKSKYNIPIRLCPNLAYDAYIPRANGIYGTWIRPEDVEIYAEFVDVLEFVCENLTAEAALLRIYQEQKHWPGNLNLLLTNLNVNIDNRIIPEDIGSIRANCGQKCMETNTCHYCEKAFIFSNVLRDKYYRDLKAHSEADKE